MGLQLIMRIKSIIQIQTITVIHLTLTDNGGEKMVRFENGLYYNLLAAVPKVAHDQPQMGPGNWKESTHNRLAPNSVVHYFICDYTHICGHL